MEVKTIARATGPFGEFGRNVRLSSPTFPVDYLKHLVEIGVAEVISEEKVEKKVETKPEVESLEVKKSSAVSQPAPRSRKKTARKSKKAK